MRGPQAHRFRRPAQIGRGEGVEIPAQIGRKPSQDPETALSMPPLDPAHRNLRDLPAESMRLHQQLDAVTEALIGLDGDALDDTPREQSKSVAGIARWQPGEVSPRTIRGATQRRLRRRTP